MTGIEPREVLRKIRPGNTLRLTVAEREWLSDVLERVRAAEVVVTRLPAEHPDWDATTGRAFKAGVLAHILAGYTRLVADQQSATAGRRLSH
jgi:hypothetical protein